MKKISTFILAMVMAMNLSQCKKNEQNTIADKGVAITLNVIDDNNNNDSTRVDVNTMTGTVDFEENDQILVASGGKYVGTLTYNGNLFTGSVYNAVAGYPLSFYFLGNITPAETLTYGETQSCSVVITDQTQHRLHFASAEQMRLGEVQRDLGLRGSHLHHGLQQQGDGEFRRKHLDSQPGGQRSHHLTSGHG